MPEYVPCAGGNTDTYHRVSNPQFDPARSCSRLPLDRRNLAPPRRRAMIDAPFASCFTPRSEPWDFADAETTARRLADAGFEDIQTSIGQSPGCWRLNLNA